MGKMWCSFIMICEAGNFLSRDAITGYHCGCIEYKATLYLVGIENEFSICFHVWGICNESAVQISDTKYYTGLLIGLKEKMNTKFVYSERFWNNFCLIGNAVYLS